MFPGWRPVGEVRFDFRFDGCNWQLLHAGFRVTPLCPAFFLAVLPAARRDRAMSAIDPGRRRLLGLRSAGGVEGAAVRAPVAAPVIDPVSCIACDACVRVCEPGALRLDPAGPSYAVDAARCTDCGLCVDICDRNAVRLERDAPAAMPTRVALYARRCRECGGDFRTTLAGPAATCRFCSRPPAARGALRLQQ